MRKLYLVLLLVLQLTNVFSQTPIDTTLSLDILQAPVSPAFNLMGISPTSIDRPTDLNAFRVSVQNSSKNFTQLPSSYAVELAPAALFNPRSQTMDKFGSTKFRDVWYQTLSVSFGFAKTDNDDAETDSASTAKVGIGIKLSLIRPSFSTETEDALHEIYINQDNLNRLKGELLFSNDTLKALREEMESIAKSDLPDSVRIPKLLTLNQKLSEQNNKVLTQKSSIEKLESTRETISKLVSDFKIVRRGGFLDAAAGTVLEFPTQKFNYSKVTKIGVWLTGGYEGKPIAVLGILRYLYNPDKIFADDTEKIDSKNISSFDYGIRLDYKSRNSKFIVGTEFLYRSVLNKNTIPSSNRLVLNASHQVGKNQAVTFTFGKNFDGSIEKGGNLIAALNLLLGFGSEKKW